MNKLIRINKPSDIPVEYSNTPIAALLEYHNLDRSFDEYKNAELLLGMCMDNRKQLNIPKNFAYIIRTGGGKILDNEFHISYAIAVGGVKYIALIGHTQCGMVNIGERKQLYINGLIEKAGWDKRKAIEQYNRLAGKAEIGNEVEFVIHQAEILKERYPEITAVPLLYKMEDHKLYIVKNKT